MTKPDIKKAISIEDNEEETEIEETPLEEKPKSPKPRKKTLSKKKNSSKAYKDAIKSQEIRQQQEQEAYAPEAIPEAHKIYRELKKIRKLLSTFKEVEVKYDRGINIQGNLPPPIIQLKPLKNLKKLGDYKEAPAQNITPQAPQTQNPKLILTKNPPLQEIPSALVVAEQNLCPPPLLNNPNNPNEIVLDNSPATINLKRCPNCNKKLNAFFGLWRKGRSKVITENGEARQTLFCRRCGWHKEIRFVV